MKLLLLVMANRKANMDGFYSAMTEKTGCEVLYLDDKQQGDLKSTLSGRDLKTYDYVLVMLRTKKLMRQCSYLRTINNLVFIEYDACLNYFPNKYQGRFTRLYKKTNPFLIISSGYQITEKLKSEGFRARFVPKGYDHFLLRNLNRTRDLKFGFIGSTKSDAYSERKSFLSDAELKLGVKSFKTDSGEPYLLGLNKIDYFLSADIGFNEYMLKNFEAMACGCVLLAYDQGSVENSALGFKDMDNVVLYSTMEELLNKVSVVEADPTLKERIRSNGQQLAFEVYGFDKIVDRILGVLESEKEDLYLFKKNRSRSAQGGSLFARWFGKLLG